MKGLVWCAVWTAVCGVTEPRTGAAANAFTVGARVSFVSEIETHPCFELRSGETRVAWVHRLHAWRGRTFVERCFAQEPELRPREGEVAGGPTGEIEEVVSPAELVRLELPDWSLVARPAFCSGRIAYWALEPAPGGRYDVHLAVWDIAARRIVASVSTGIETIQTDSSVHLPEIRWSDSGRRVSGRGVTVRLP